MSKRTVIDPVTKFVSHLVRTPEAERGTGRRSKPQKYFKRNYIEATKIVTPNVYFDDGRALSGTEINETDQLINSHVIAAQNAADVISVSGFISPHPSVDLSYLSSVSSIAGLSQFFVKQNNLTWVTPDSFEKNILSKNSKSFSDFDGSSGFLDWVSGTLLSSIACPTQGGYDWIADLESTTYASDGSGTHKYLIDKLSWLYFLNRPDPATTTRPEVYATSAEVATLMAQKLWAGIPIDLADCMKVFEKYLWSNYITLSSVSEKLIPTKYRTSGAGEWVSGVQHRDRLETLANIVYAGDYFNNTDRFVETTFQDYISTSALITDVEAADPLTRFLKAISFSVAERSSESQEIETLVDIDACPDSYLPYLADLIGWNLIGPDASRHRNQLRNAVAIYKAKGTKRSVQAMVDTVFGTPSAFNITSGSLFDLYESYIPNLIFYTIATSSTLTEKGNETFTKEKAQSLGLDGYSAGNFDTNVRLAVDRIMWELANEFPNNFIFGNKPFPRVKFFFEDNEDEEYVGPWHRMENGDYYTGETFIATAARQIIPTQDPSFVFSYRNRVMPIPPWEEIKYYVNCEISLALLEGLRKKLVCFGVSVNASNKLIAYIKGSTFENEVPSFYTNSFLFFTTYEHLPPNYDQIINVKRPIGEALVKYLPYWNAKSSHFKIVLSASSFDFTSETLDKASKYALSKVKTFVNTVAPAHSIPNIVLDVSTVEDVNLGLSALTAPKAIMGLSSVAGSGASATMLTNFAVSAINPRNTAVLAADQHNKFSRIQADSLNDPLFGSGVGDIFFSAAPRNALRRKNYKYLMKGENIDLRDGKGSAGYDFLYRATQTPSGFYGFAGGPGPSTSLLNSGTFSLGFIPSTLSFAPVPLKRDPNGFGNLINTVEIDPVWQSCQSYSSSDTFYQIEVSNTFPFRGLSGIDSSSPSGFFGRRGSLNELQAMQHRVQETLVFQEASSIVSGYFTNTGMINTAWPASSSKIEPTTLSSWYVDSSKNVVQSIANQLTESTSAVTNVNYMRDFTFGDTFHRLYRKWLTNYTRVPINFNFKQSTANNIISHTYGPYIFNGGFEITASSIDDVAPQLITSSLDNINNVIDIGYNQGFGVLSQANEFGITNTSAIEPSTMYVWWPEMRNDTLLSGVEFVDTSNPFQALGGGGNSPGYVYPPTFVLIQLKSLLKDVPPKILRAIQQASFKVRAAHQPPRWLQSSVLDDNMVIQYGRANINSLPRLRYKIEPDSARPDIKNFLVEDCEYQIDITAGAALRGAGTGARGAVGVWIHTEPIPYTYRLPNGSYKTEDSVWSFVNGKWVRKSLNDINTTPSFGLVTAGLSLRQNIIIESLSQVLRNQGEESSSRRSSITNEVITPYKDLTPRIGCIEVADAYEPDVPTISNPQIFKTLTFNFNTDNKLTAQQVPGKVHRSDRKYYIEIFAPKADPHILLVFDEVSMHNKTFKEDASVPITYSKYKLNKQELKACFDYFTDLAKSELASRVAANTEAYLEASGGGRLNYRDNIKREIYEGLVDPYYQLSSLIIRGD
jgi:hypothetical protein